MEYQKIANLIDDTSNQPSKFRTRNWVEINDESRGVYNVNNQIKFKTTMLKSSLCDYSDAYILVKGKITIAGAGNDVAARQADERNKGVVFKNCAPFINCISEINNTQIDNAKDIDIVMPMYNLIEYSEPVDDDNDIEDSKSFKSKTKITGKTPNDVNEKDVEIMVLLKYLSNFWRNLEMPLINCEVNLILTWSSTCVITESNGAGTFAITDTKLDVPVVILSTQEITNFLQQLKSGLLAQNASLNHLVEPSFQGVNRLFFLAFEDDAQRTAHDSYYLLIVEIKD